jgi:hypothetical protein
LKIAANKLYPTVCNSDEEVPKILQGTQPPKTDENETATKTEPAACHILKCPNLSIYHGNNRKQNYFHAPKQPKKRSIVYNKKFVEVYEFQPYRR